jgi:hypothetical protein
MKLPVELQAGESVVLRCRRHPIYLCLRLAGTVFAAVVPVALVLWLGLATVGLGGAVGAVLAGVCAIWALYWAIRGYFIWYRHEHDEWIVTNQRLLDTYKRHWFDQQIASADLINVQDITVHRSGLLPTIFNFGDVRCQTAGTDSVFVLSGIPTPSKALATIDATRDAARTEIDHGGPGFVPP